MRSQRRDLQVFSLSFLDCICCGFGVVILLFVLSKFGEPLVIEQSTSELQATIARLEQTLHKLRGETEILNRELASRKDQLSEEKRKIARLRGDLSSIQGEHAAAKQDSEVQMIIEGKLALALQELTEEMKRLLKDRPRRATPSIGGIPVDSEYIVFVIDTSGSMQSGAWSLVRKKMEETLKVYPKVKGIQVMNDNGIYMFSQYRSRWIPDTPARRKAILDALTTWRPFSNSSPVEGIEEAVRSFYDPKKKISLYVFGDEYSGGRMQPVVDTVNQINMAASDGSRRVRIHAVGFPTVVNDPRGVTGVRFATLMRALCSRNGGAFVGLNTTRP